MTEKSQFWYTDGFTGATGDGAAPYTQEEFRAFLYAVFGYGVVVGEGNELAVTGTASPLEVDTGRAMVAGFHYWNDDVLELNVETPTSGTTGGRVMLQADWSTATVRAVVKMAADGTGTPPSPTQNIGTIFEMSLAIFQIETDGSIIGLTPTRQYARTGNNPDEVTLTETATKKMVLKAGGISDTYLGNRVPAASNRQGGSATDWSAKGNSNYVPDKVLIQAGSKDSDTGTMTVTFPTAFSDKPLVFLSSNSAAITNMNTAGGITASGFVANITQSSNNQTVHWLAIGPRS